jgi:hypothetical protein
MAKMMKNVPHICTESLNPFAVPISVFMGGVGKKDTRKLGCEKYFCMVIY